jgi:hypothetical protein
VPPGWNEIEDRRYLESDWPPVEAETTENCRAELVEGICTQLENYHGALTFALSYLTGQPYEPDGVFRHFPVKTKVQLLQKLFHERSRDEGYLDRLDDNLKKFLDFEIVCIPILERYLLKPETVWLRELVDVSNSIDAVVFDFSESLACEHPGCPNYVTVDRIDPPLPWRESDDIEKT